jgi:hypothetical protein
VRCLSCNYDLRDLPEHRCPECGRDFDPNDPRTFAVDRTSRFPLGWFLMGMFAGFCLGVAALYLLILVALSKI